MRDWKNKKNLMFYVCLFGIAIFIFGCQKDDGDYKNCPAKGEISQYWTKFNVPKVEGAMLCEDYTIDKEKSRLKFVHFHKGEQIFSAFYFPYKNEFIKNGWQIEKEYYKSETDWGMYVFKNGERFYASFEPCFSNRSSVSRPCSKVSLVRTNEVIKPDK